MKRIITLVFTLSFYCIQAQMIDAEVISPSCFGEDSGSIDVTFTGGISPYMYQWSNGAATEDIEFLLGGLYSITITDSQNQNFVGEWIIDEPTPITVDGVTQDPYCNINNGLPDGSIDVIATGGTDDFNYMWQGPGVNNSTDPFLSNLTEGFYLVTVTDSNGCSEMLGLDLVQPDEIIIDANIQNLDCIDGESQFGSIELNVEGGFAPLLGKSMILLELHRSVFLQLSLILVVIMRIRNWEL